MPLVVGIPDPDVSPVFYHACLGRGLHTDGLEGAQRRANLLVALDLHGHGYGALRVGDRDCDAVTYFQRLRGQIENPAEQVGEAGWNWRFRVGNLAVYEVFLVQDGFGLAIIHVQRGIDLASTLHRLLVKIIRTSALPVEVRLKPVIHMKEQIDGPDRRCSRIDALAVAVRLETNHRRSCRKYSPINRIGKRLLQRKAETRVRRRQRIHSRRLRQHGRRKAAEEDGKMCASVQRRAWLLMYFACRQIMLTAPRGKSLAGLAARRATTDTARWLL